MAAQSKLTEVLNYDTWVHAVSGAAAGVIAMATFYPLDTIRSRLQLEDPDKTGAARSTFQMLKDIIFGEGVTALYSGLAPVLQSLCISNFIYFYSFHGLKAFLSNGSPKAKQSALKDLLIGSIAGVINVFLTAPLWVSNSRLRMRNVPDNAYRMSDKVNGLISCLAYIAKTEGMSGLWSGLWPSLSLVSNPALNFMMYETLKRNVLRFFGTTEISSLGSLLIGGLSKLFSTSITYPLLLVQTKQRNQTAADDTPSTSEQSKKNLNRDQKAQFNQSLNNNKTGMIEMMCNIVLSQGFKGLYRGLEAKILQTVLTTALMFMTYEKIAKTVQSLLKVKK